MHFFWKTPSRILDEVESFSVSARLKILSGGCRLRRASRIEFKQLRYDKCCNDEWFSSELSTVRDRANLLLLIVFSQDCFCPQAAPT